MENIHLRSLQPLYAFWVITPSRAMNDDPPLPQQHSNLQPDLEAMFISRQSLIVGLHLVYFITVEGHPFYYNTGK